MNNRLILILITCPLFWGCAGPTTPFGPVNSFKPLASINEFMNPNSPSQSLLNPRDLSSQKPQISFTPDRQILHDKMDLTVAVVDRKGVMSKSQIIFKFNGHLLEDSKHSLFVPPNENQKGYLTLKKVRLRDDRENRIQAFYKRHPQSLPVKYELMPPDCSFRQSLPVHDTTPFKPSSDLIQYIHTQAQAYDFNPSFVTGLIAQESAFRPEAMSWAKAIGLTQVTPIGDRQIEKLHPTWPRSEKIRDLPAPVVKALIQSGGINQNHDWRLDPKKSVMGGLTLLKDFHNYWNRPEIEGFYQRNLNSKKPDPTTVLLASYHSGPTRVRNAMIELGSSFIQHKELGEARRYVKRVKSYCYHFAQGSPR